LLQVHRKWGNLKQNGLLDDTTGDLRGKFGRTN
jgi:hypothetical protein